GMTHTTRTWLASVLVTMASLALPAGPAAQHIRVKAGFNLSTIKVTPNAAPEAFSQRVGPIAGFFFASSGNQIVGLQWELLYTQKGAQTTGDCPGSCALGYAELPLMARILIVNNGGMKVHANVGLSADYLLTARATAGGFETGVTSQYERADVGVVLGGSVSVSRALIDVRYGLGLRDTVKNS